MNKERIELRKWHAAVILVCLLVFGAAVGSLTATKVEAAAPTPTEAGSSQPLVDATSLAQGFRPVVKEALPAVVNISTTKVVQTRSGQSPFPSPLFEFFGRDFGFGPEMPRQFRENSLGSGVIVSADGYILTNDHVVDSASEIAVTLGDKRDLNAKVVGTDPKTDIAVLKVDANDLPHLKLGDSTSVGVGDIVLAMGNPFGIGQTVTMGIVSATGRGGLNPSHYEDFIQTDAAINPGNSGGPLVNVRGEVVGINTAILSRSGGNQGVGFAVPSNMASDVMQQIINKGRVVRGWLGVQIQPVDAKVAQAFDLANPGGALVGDVNPDSPAARSGLKNGDVIVGVDQKKIDDPRDLQWMIARAGPDRKVNLDVIRDGHEITVPVTLGELPGEPKEGTHATGSGSALDGVQIDDLTPQIARQLGLPAQTYGVVITAVEPGSTAAEAGLKRGDVIQEVDRKPVHDAAAFERAVNDAGSGSILLLVNSGGSTHFVVLEQ